MCWTRSFRDKQLIDDCHEVLLIIIGQHKVTLLGEYHLISQLNDIENVLLMVIRKERELKKIYIYKSSGQQTVASTTLVLLILVDENCR
jgi:hypothetical protein